MKYHFPNLLRLLNDETASSSSSSSSSSSPLPTSSTKGTIAAPILNILSHLTSTSTGAAREIATGLDSTLRDGVLPRLIHPPNTTSNHHRLNKRKRPKLGFEGEDEKDKDDTTERTRREKRRKRIMAETRIACLHLASALLETDDSVVTSYVTAAGSREGKIKPGIVYVALQKGLGHGSLFGKGAEGGVVAGEEEKCREDRDHHRAVYRLLRNVRLKLLTPKAAALMESTAKRAMQNDSTPLSNRALIDLLKREPLDQLTRLSLLAPKSSHNLSEEQPQSKTSKPTSMTSLELIGLESRRIIHILLLEDHSPFLQHLHSSNNRSTDTSSSDKHNSTMVQQCLHQLGRCVRTLTTPSPSSSSSSTVVDIPTREFIQRCLSKTPVLLSYYFRNTAVPEPKPSFSCIASYDFLAQIMDVHVGSTMTTVWDWDTLCETIGGGSSSSSSSSSGRNRSDQLLSYILPNRLTKNILSKALQSTNALMVTQTLKLLISILHRAERVLGAVTAAAAARSGVVVGGGGGTGWDSVVSSSSSEGLMEVVGRRMPDVQVVLAIRSRFDPFRVVQEEGEEEEERLSANDIITVLFCDVLQRYALLFPAIVRSVRFDWIKILPDTPEAFIGGNGALQHRMLTTLGVIYKFHTDKPSSSNSILKSVITFIHLMLKANSDIIYNLARDLAIKTLSSIITTRDITSDNNTSLYTNHEITLWLDGITQQNIPIFYKLLTATQKITVQHAVMISHAYQQHFPNTQTIPAAAGITFSPLLSTAMAGIASDPLSFPASFVVFVSQVATKMLLFQVGADVLPLAAFTCTVFSHCSWTDYCRDHGDDEIWNGVDAREVIVALHRYAKAIVEDNGEKSLLASSLTLVCFGEDNYHSEVASMALRDGDDQNYDDNYRKLEHFNSVAHSLDATLALQSLRQCCQYPSFANRHGAGNRATTECEIVTKLLATIVQEPINAHVLQPVMDQLLNGNTDSIMYMSCLLIVLSSIAVTSNSNILFSDQNLPSYIIELLKHKLVFNPQKGRKGIVPLLLPVGLLKYFPEMNVKCVVEALQQQQQHHTEEDDESQNNNSTGSATVVFRALLLRCLNTTTVLPNKSMAQTMFPIDRAFYLWKNISERRCGDNHGSCIVSDLRRRLEGLMTTVLISSERYGMTATRLFVCICDSNPTTVVNLAFNHMISEDGKDTNKPRHGHLKDWNCHKFILSLLSYDMVVFAVPLLSRMTKENWGTSWQNDRWDDIVAIIIREFEGQNERFETSWFTSLSHVVEAICEKASNLMEKILCEDHSSSTVRSFEIIFTALASVISLDTAENLKHHNLWNNLANFAHKLRKKGQRRKISVVEKTFLKFVRKIAMHRHGIQKDSHVYTCSSPFCISALTYSCSVLRKVQKKSMNVDLYSIGEEVLLTIYSLLLDRDAIGKLVDSEEVLDSSLKCLVVYCLKHGLASDCTASFSSLCIKTVRCLLTIAFASRVDTCNIKIFFPHQVHAMILSHSEFRTFILNCDSSPRYDLISLLICCVDLDGGMLKEIGKDAILTLLSVHNAGLSDVDCLLRRLIRLYETNEQLPQLYANEFRWGNLPEISWGVEHNLEDTDHDQHWEWFIQGLETRRIRLTLANFPLHDTITPGESVENWTDLNSQVIDPPISHDEELNGQTENKAQSSDVNEMHFNLLREINGVRIVSDKKLADRYSPSFLIPLVLSVLEGYAIKAESIETKNMSSRMCGTPNVKNGTEGRNDHPSLLRDMVDDTEVIEEMPNPWRESFVKITYRLSKKGIISLALACLSSRCPELRQTTVAVLFLFLKALRTREAAAISAWRERPQLVMIIDSVQRGLVIRRAMKISKEGRSINESDPPSFLVPMLPAVNSLFLARSALILSKPADKMFPAMNKFFLRLENHGAHEDCFSLPAFMSLYCSAADGTGRARTERQWALNLLKDGTLDEFCYKVVSRRHAPELLLTSFESLARRSDDEDDESEGLLLLDTIQNLIKSGGILSYHHLVCTVGFFSWMKGVLQCLLLKSSFSTLVMKYKIVTLLHSALVITIQNYTKDASTFFFEPAPLAKALVQICIDTVGDKIDSTRNSLEDVSFASCIAEVLWLIRDLDIVQSKGGTDIPTFAISQSGIPLKQAVTLLKLVQNEGSTFSKAVGALCYLPGSTQPMTVSKVCHEAAVQLCKISLKCMLNNCNKHICKSIDVHIMNRITMLMCFNCNLKDDISLIELILGARHNSLLVSKIYDAWLQCLSKIVKLDGGQKIEEKSQCHEIEFLKALATKGNR